MKKLTAGILAHVDSGKTTLSEALLYKAGQIRRLGRVDHGDSFLDGNVLERERGITIFSKQAEMQWKDTGITLLDTPGHVDFSAEMERTLSVLDCAILVVSANDGVQSHTQTLWKLLKRYRVPTLIFVNKMDLALRRQDDIQNDLRRDLGNGCIDLGARIIVKQGQSIYDSEEKRERDPEELENELTLASDILTEQLLENGSISEEDIAGAVMRREIFPCYYGSALKMTGISELLDGMCRYINEPSFNKAFSARVFKIMHDENGERLTFSKITGGSVAVKDEINDQKINQIRIYSGQKYRMTDQAGAGDVCAFTGLADTFPGQGLGEEPDAPEESLEPYMTYRVILPKEVDVHRAFSQFLELTEEDPMLRCQWDEHLGALTIQVMGQVQLEILKSIVKERYGYKPQFDQGRIVYRETLAPGSGSVEGIGHFEPLRHYAEVHLLLEPAERGSGVTVTSSVSEDELDRNWQRLILTHLMEKQHRGVLTGAPLTDVKITVAAGKAHKKHTEGGDFREATYRAVRNGLMKAENILLEPWMDFVMDVPSDNTGRAIADIQKMHGTFGDPLTDGERTVLKGQVPASEAGDYPTVLAGYTKGSGHISLTMSGYAPCHDQEGVVAASGYDPLRDVENTADSVFCPHGSAEIVPWDQVEQRMALSSVLKKGTAAEAEDLETRARRYSQVMASDGELMAIFERTYGPVRHDPLTAPGRNRRRTKPARPPREESGTEKKVRIRNTRPQGPTYMLIDGYNLIHAWKELDQLAQKDFSAARERLIDILCNYQGFTQYEVILVFDAYKVKGGIGSQEKVRNINVVYTKEAETADMYIEKVTHEIARKYDTRVVTSDGMEQLIILGHGALRISSREFVEDVLDIDDAIAEAIEERNRAL